MKKKGNTESLEEVLKMEEKIKKKKKKEKREGRIRRRCRKHIPKRRRLESARDKILLLPAASNCPTANS